ncbi:hypothetical protein ACFPOA_15125 [Lysobacter niabensis]
MSTAIATTRSKKRTSARNIKTVDVGVLSFAKTQFTYTQSSDRIQPGSPKADRVFVCDAVGTDLMRASGSGFGSAHRARAGRPVAVGKAFALVRLAHRRLVAGSPAAGFELGCC